MNAVRGLRVGMICYQFKQIVRRNAVVLHDLSGEFASNFDSFRSFRKGLQVCLLTHRRRSCPNQFRPIRVFLAGGNSLEKFISVLLFRIAPAMQAIVEVDR